MNGRGRWISVSQEADHPLAALEGQALADGRLRVELGPTSRFGARYFNLTLEMAEGHIGQRPVFRGWHNSGPLPSYNWVEVAETNDHIALPNGDQIELGTEGIGQLFALLFAVLPPGGHLMVEYDSAQRAETARALAHGVPAIATPLGSLLFRLGFGAHFKDWQIAEGGSEGPRKLQAYKPPSKDDAERWRREAVRRLDAFLAGPPPDSDVVRAARERASELLSSL